MSTPPNDQLRLGRYAALRSSPGIKAFVFCCMALLVGVAWRVLIPAYQREHDAPTHADNRDQLRQIRSAIEQFVAQNPEHRFPSNLTEVTTLTVSGTSKFVYLPPPANASQQELRGRVILVEKLGHYKYSDGGVWETVDGSSHAVHYNMGILMHFNMNLTFPIADW